MCVLYNQQSVKDLNKMTESLSKNLQKIGIFELFSVYIQIF